MKKHNFGSGPAILPDTVFKEAANAVNDYNSQGLSILEISHRSEAFQAILKEAIQLVRELYDVPEDFAVLYLTGGASSQFYMTAMNLLNQNETAGFINTGSWSVKAIKEARLFGKVYILGSSEAAGFTYIPKSLKDASACKYVHLTSNNTIYGTQFSQFPKVEPPLVCDMSSDCFTRKIDFNQFDLIYAGAQKNLGPAGTTLVMVRKSALGNVDRDIPTMLDYRTHIKKNSAFNTPPVFPIFVSMLNLRWLKEKGGLEIQEKENLEKSAALYKAIDQSTCFTSKVQAEDRSTVNVTFEMAPSYTEFADQFVQLCAQADCIGVKGHRSVGGFRASIYNAMPQTSVEALIEVIKDFDKKYA